MTALVAANVFAGNEGSKASQTADAIRREALRPNGDPEGLPLPLAANWNTGWDRGISPKIQLELIEQGHYLLPWVGQPPLWEQLMHPNMFEAKKDGYRDRVLAYYQAPIQRMAELKLPFTVTSTQWEYPLTYRWGTNGPDQKYPWPDLPGDQNPNIVNTNGTILNGGAGRVSPFGPVGPWREVGREWTTAPIVTKLQEWYPNPPLVMFLSNNEHGRLELDKVEMDRRYVALYGKGKDNNFKSQVMEKGYTERLRALQQGMRDGMVSTAWKKNAIFVGYDVMGRQFYYDPPEAWDGGSPSFYNHNWLPMTDYWANSASIGTMYWVATLQEAFKLNPKFWWEISTWDGWVPNGKPMDKIQWYRDHGQTWDPPRYAGFTQFGMWLHRPRVVREFRGSGQSWEDLEPYFRAVMTSVDRVHNNPTLRAFWRKGRLVENREHPYFSGKAEQYTATNPWFLLETSLDSARPWKAETEVAVFALALVQGQAPQRQWLVYAHAPLGERKGVEITVPDYGKITVDITQAGSFYLVDEKTKKATEVKGP